MKIVISSSAIIYDGNARVLLAQRSNNKKLDPGLWETIGGTIEFGESPEECLRREIKEELGCEVKNLILFNIYNYFVKNNLQLISIVYLATIAGIPKFNKDEIQDLRWFSEDEAIKLEFAVNCKQRVIDFFNSQRCRNIT
ncbi:MAG: NUDIX hydrolase [Candidatus Poribacteria bacterium]